MNLFIHVTEMAIRTNKNSCLFFLLKFAMCEKLILFFNIDICYVSKNIIFHFLQNFICLKRLFHKF